ncbi:MAG: carbon-nitrogen hydrolase family protein [Gammaproteobacteria bacterium]
MAIISAIQMCSSHHIDENLKLTAKLIQEAVKQQAVLIVLPEMFAIMGLTEQDKVLAKETFGAGVIQDFLSAQAKMHGTWILGGTIPIATENVSKVRAASILYNSNGEVAARYDKIHLFDVELSPKESYKESNTTEPGTDLVVVDTPVGKLGLGVCYDIRFPEMFRLLQEQGAEVIALPSAFTVKTGHAHWELLVRARAVENGCYMIGAALGGTHTNGRKTYGHSLIVDPWGNMIAELANDEPGVIFADIDLKKLYEIRKTIPTQLHRKF